MGQPSDCRAGAPRGPRARALVVGLALSVCLAVALPYNEMLIKGSRLALSSCTPAAFFLLFLWLVLVNPLLRLVRRSWALSRVELLVVFAMTMVATAVPTRGVTGMLLGMVGGTHYYASPENQWAELVLPHVPSWMIVQGAPGLRHFFEGVPRGESPEWQVWLEPLFGWALFLAALWLAVLCLMAILRRQWVERERLAFPVLHVPLAMVEESDGRFLPPFFRSRLMWLGFAVTFAVASADALHNYFPEFPVLFAQTPTLVTLRGTVRIGVRLNPLMLGFAYLVNTRLSFSIWFFYLVYEFTQGVFTLLGVSCTEELGAWSPSGAVEPIFAHQSLGAMIVFVVAGLWAARQHLGAVLRGAWRPDPRAEADEMVSYRGAVFGLAAGLVTMTAWLARAGTPLWIAVAVVAIAFVIFISLTRAMVDGGVAVIVPAMVPLGFALSAFGADALGPKGMAVMAFSLVWAGDLLMFMMAPCAHAARVASELPRGRGRVFAGVLLAMACAFVVSVVVMLGLGYEHGAANLHWQYFNAFPQYPAQIISTRLLNPTGPSLAGWGWTALGAAVMALLTLAHYRLPWWPLHPLGYMVSPSWVIGSIWFPFFVAWLVKSLVLRIGGMNAYRRSCWLFYGLILGQIVVAGCWLVIDALTGTTENRIPLY